MPTIIPEHAKCVFKGVLFDVYQWEQEEFDGSTTTFEKLKRRATVEIVGVVDGKILTIMQEQALRPEYPSLVAGKIDPGEEPIEAARRELLEETGYEGDLVLIESYYGSNKIYFPEYLFVAQNCKKVSEQQLEGGERASVKILSFDEFLQLCRNKSFSASKDLKFTMYEALLDSRKKEELRRKIFGS